MLIRSPKYGLITPAPVNPDNISGLLLPGSDTLFCEKDFGTILVQQFNTENYFLRHSIFNFFKKMTLLFKEEKTGLRTQLALKSGLGIKTHGEGKLHLMVGAFVFLNGSPDRNPRLRDAVGQGTFI